MTTTATATATPTLIATPTAEPTATATATPTPSPADLWISQSDLRIHPDGDEFYSGDLISFHVFAHHGGDWDESEPPDVDLEIWLGQPGLGELLVDDRIAFHGRKHGEARYEWVWDTTGLQGEQTLTLVLDPDDVIQAGDEETDNNAFSRVVDLRPYGAMPSVWAETRWVQRASTCCVFHYLSGTAAERDIVQVMAVADEAVAYAGEKLGEETDKVRLDVYLIDRVLGHGGFATDALVVSYLDRFYPGGDWTQVFRHEGAHVLDQRFTGDRLTLLTEGLAVYVAGGHFREEPLFARAAALLDLGGYIPLSELADNFYPSQHEIGYLEAGSFVSFLVERFGWDAVKTFYGAIRTDGASHADVLDAALANQFGWSLDRAETEWLEFLKALPKSTTQVTDLRLTLDFYDTVRRYQQGWDSSAYFLEAWLPTVEEAVRRGLTADLMRHPDGPLNLSLEAMFIEADRALDAGAYERAQALLIAINRVLDADGDLRADDLADQYRAVVEFAAKAGREVQNIELDWENGRARVLVSSLHQADTVQLTLRRVAGSWRVTVSGNQ